MDLMNLDSYHHFDFGALLFVAWDLYPLEEMLLWMKKHQYDDLDNWNLDWNHFEWNHRLMNVNVMQQVNHRLHNSVVLIEFSIKKNK